MKTKFNLQDFIFPILLTLISSIFYFLFAYNLIRTEYSKLVLLYSGLFVLFYLLLKINHRNFNYLVGISFLFRVIFIFSIPNLSQDFYRFIWDGRMILEGFNPYLFTPESFISKGELPVYQARELYDGMGSLSASHYTNYPPLNQLCFVIAGFFAGKSIFGSVIVLRLLIVLADLGTLVFGKKLLNKLKLPQNNVFWYLLNPFIIIELTGNLHFESVMIFFLVWSLYLLHIGRWKFAAIILACSVSIKLIPLIFLPLFFQYLMQGNESTYSIRNFKRIVIFYLVIGFTTLILFLPFYSIQFLTNYSETVGLWFQNFEFNASIYYIAREIGYLFRGWNEIAIIGKIIPIIVILFIFIMTFFRKNRTSKELMTAMLFVLSFYYFMSTTIHPWYIATLLILSIFTKYKFPLVWSFIIIISYLAYANSNNTENLLIIGLEYVIVYGIMFWELFAKNKKNMVPLSLPK